MLIRRSGVICAAVVLTGLIDGCAARVSPPLDPSYTPRSIGPGPRYRPPPAGGAVAQARPLAASGGGALACSAAPGRRYGLHLELFAGGRVVAIPAGIGFAPPRRREGAYVTAGRCSYPLRTVEPTGLVEARAGTRLVLGDLFAIWGQRLSDRRLAAFRAPPGQRVRAYVGGRRWRGPLDRIPLARHAQIVLEVGAAVAPHPRYLFPGGL